MNAFSDVLNAVKMASSTSMSFLLAAIDEQLNLWKRSYIYIKPLKHKCDFDVISVLIQRFEQFEEIRNETTKEIKDLTIVSNLFKIAYGLYFYSCILSNNCTTFQKLICRNFSNQYKLKFVFYVKTDVSPVLEWCSFKQKVRFWYSKGVKTQKVSKVHKCVNNMKCWTCISNGVKNM